MEVVMKKEGALQVLTVDPGGVRGQDLHSLKVWRWETCRREEEREERREERGERREKREERREKREERSEKRERDETSRKTIWVRRKVKEERR